MKNIIYVLLLFNYSDKYLYSQTNIFPEITPQILKKINAEVELLVPQYKQNLSKQNLNADEIEFSLDTFQIEQVLSKKMDIDFSTAGMNINVLDCASSYDKLLNKYYNKLLKTLKPENKKILIKAQREWLNFRDAEYKLIYALNDEVYADGGTMRTNIETGVYCNMIIRRTIEIFNYYDALKNKL